MLRSWISVINSQQFWFWPPKVRKQACGNTSTLDLPSKTATLTRDLAASRDKFHGHWSGDGIGPSPSFPGTQETAAGGRSEPAVWDLLLSLCKRPKQWGDNMQGECCFVLNGPGLSSGEEGLFMLIVRETILFKNVQHYRKRTSLRYRWGYKKGKTWPNSTDRCKKILEQQIDSVSTIKELLKVYVRAPFCSGKNRLMMVMSGDEASTGWEAIVLLQDRNLEHLNMAAREAEEGLLRSLLSS